MNHTKKNMKALVVIALTFVLLLNAFMPIAVQGSDRDVSSEYQYYSVKAGDTLTRIAKNNGVTVSDIMTANKLSNADRITAGQVLKVPLSSASAQGNGLNSTRVSMTLKDANIQDVISAIALNAGYTVVMEKSAQGNNETVSVNLEEMSSLKAIDAVTRLVGLTYLKNGNTLMIGTPEGLNSTFVDKTALTKITLDYISAEALQAQMSALGLSNVQMVATNNKDEFYISGYPKELAKVADLKNLLDVSSNIMAGGSTIPSHVTALELTHIDASEFNGFLGELGLSQGIVLGSRPYTLYVYVTGKNLSDIKTIQKLVDRPLSGANLQHNGAAKPDTSVPDTTVPQEPTTVPNGTVTPPVLVPDTTAPVEPTPAPVEPEVPVLDKVTLTNINRKEAENILASFPLEVKIYGPEKCAKALWLAGTRMDVDAAIEKIQEFDTPDYAAQLLTGDTSFFFHDLTNCTAEEMLDRLGYLQLDGVTFRPNGNGTLVKSLVVYCPSYMKEHVENLLDEMDVVNVSAQQTNYVVEANADQANAKKRIDILKSLYPELNDGSKYAFSYNTIPDKEGNEKCITYVKTSAEGVSYIRALLAEMDSAN